jgi:hypothetical protein
MRAHNAAGWSPLGKIILIFILLDNCKLVTWLSGLTLLHTCPLCFQL